MRLEQLLEKKHRECEAMERTALTESTEAERLRGDLKTAKKGAKALRQMIVELTANHERALLTQGRDYLMRVTELETQLTGVTAQRDTAQANFEWARLMFNKGEAERAILTQRIIERPVQAFSLDREAGLPPPTDGTARATDRPPGVEAPRPMGEATEYAIGGLASRLGVMFEDVGDEDAKRMGVDHDA